MLLQNVRGRYQTVGKERKPNRPFAGQGHVAISDIEIHVGGTPKWLPVLKRA